tara:strand:- start:1100 stop:1603 length:504 start_codon:yes stop_codon:yes gene_type:complete
MPLLLLEEMIKIKNILIQITSVFFIQLLLSDFLAIGTIRPDFMVILVLYWSNNYGRLFGMIMGFIIGFLSDLSGTASFFGLSPLTYLVTGYLIGSLKNKIPTINLFYFSILWIFILCFQFFISSAIRYQHLIGVNNVLFWSNWIGTCVYTLCFCGIFQFIYPLQRNI